MCFYFTFGDVQAEGLGDFQVRGRLVSKVWAWGTFLSPVSLGKGLYFSVPGCSHLYTDGG